MKPEPCRCPPRPRSEASGSAHETRLLEDWQATHGAHPYARMRDALAGALQEAEGATGDAEAVLCMVADVFGVPREALLRAVVCHPEAAERPVSP